MPAAAGARSFEGMATPELVPSTSNLAFAGLLASCLVYLGIAAAMRRSTSGGPAPLAG